MARSDQLRSEIARLESAVGGHQKELAKYQKKADDASAKARSEHSRAEKTKSDATRRSARTAAEGKEKDSSGALKKVGKISTKIANANKTIATKRASLRSAEQAKNALRTRQTIVVARRRRPTLAR